MRIHRWKWCLWTMGIGLYAGSAALAVWALFWPCTEPIRPSASGLDPSTNRDATEPPSRRIDRQQFAAIWSKPLRAPLHGTPAKSMELSQDSRVDTDAMLNFTLRGTMVENGRSVAVFATPESAIELKGIGDVVGDADGGAEVVEIHRDQVVLRYQGHLITMPFPDGDGP